MSLAFRTARTFWLKKNVKWSEVRPAPAAAGDSLLVSRFLPTRELSNNRITLHRTTSAKTRATATLRQRHIPPNVVCHAGKPDNKVEICHRLKLCVLGLKKLD